MFYETQLRLLRDTLRKCRIQTTLTDMATLQNSQPDLELRMFLSGDADPASLLQQAVSEIQPATVYRLRDPIDCRYIFLRLPELPKDMILTIGPYLCVPPTDKQFMEWAESKGISPRQLKQLESYYATLPLLPETSQLFMFLEAFYEHLWGVNGFTVEYLDGDFLPAFPLLAEKKAASEEGDALWHMKTMEQRYNHENELMNAVSKGQIHKANTLLNNFSTYFFEQRVADPVRNAKNYCIIMNTLLRKAAEKGGVHPMYLDNVSSVYAVKIEQLLSIEEVVSMMTEMFRGYCRLVRKHSMGDYSPPVQQALVCIDTNLAGNLSLRSLSESLNISSSYLSTIFKKETGHTLTDYIAQRRVDRAMELLRTTRLQIQTIAQHCGILDVHYFSKIFKKITGQTPKAYRESIKG